jgi:aldose 1-epimerase
MTVTATRGPFGVLADGTRIDCIEFANESGMRARVLAYGATLQSVIVPDRDGIVADVALGYATLEQYVSQPRYFGVTVGRFANRIAGGTFLLDGRRYALARNDGPNALHGGVKGFDKVVWTIGRIAQGETASAVLSYVSPDGEEGYPGTLSVDVTYALTDDNELSISYVATADRPTVLNLTNHSLFNMAGEGSGRSALDARLTLNADYFTPVDAGLIPTGELREVANTPFDFRKPATVASRIRDARDAQIAIGRGYDHNFVLNGGATTEPKFAVRLEDPVSGRVMELLTTEPGVQFYSGNFLDATVTGRSGHAYRQGDGLAFEVQHFPDSPNHPAFPSTRLDPGGDYKQISIYRFSKAEL